MNDMASVIVPRSDQTNADDLVVGPMTIKITGVAIRPNTEQPISISFEGDNGKPYKPCKSMCRVMVTAWGADSKKYAGRSMTLYREPTVKWGGMEVGGIRISHMSDLDSALTMALTATKGSKKPFTVRPLKESAPPASASPAPPPASEQESTQAGVGLVTMAQAAELELLAAKAGVSVERFLKKVGVLAFAELRATDYADAVTALQERIEAKA